MKLTFALAAIIMAIVVVCSLQGEANKRPKRDCTEKEGDMCIRCCASWGRQGVIKPADKDGKTCECLADSHVPWRWCC